MTLRSGLHALVLSTAFGVTATGFGTSWSTYLGGSGMDVITSIATDRSGNIYVAGWTDSSNFPTSITGWGRGGGVDAFVAKWTQRGATLVYCRYLGGSGTDRAYGLAVDSSGNVYVTGVTASSDFPVANPFQSRPGGGQDAFAAKIDSSGNLIYSTYLGGWGTDGGNAIAVDSTGRAYITGETTSSQFPVYGALQNSYHGQADAFITVLGPSGNQLVYSTYLGGTGDDHGRAIAIDAAGNAYVTGDTTSTDFPRVNSFQGSSGGGQDAFVAKISSSGQLLLYSTYLGGAGSESSAGIAVDISGNVYVAGFTQSPNFPLANAIKPTLNAPVNGFLSKLNAAGNALVYSTYLGGTSSNFNTAIAVDSAGNAFVAGYTASSNFPVTSTTQPGLAGAYDAFLVKISADGGSFLDSTFIGGTQSDAGNAVALDDVGAAYVAGQTLSTDFPVKNAGQQNNAGTYDAFITRLTLPPQYGGNHDSTTCTAITGWAWDANNPSSPVSVDIVDGSTVLATISANQFRDDLLAAGLGNGYHAFNYSSPASIRDGKTHTIWVRVTGSTFNLSSTPQSVTCAALYQSYVDATTCTTISGWVWNKNDPNTPITIDVLNGTSLLTTMSANEFRGDLLSAGMGNGYHGFTYSTPIAIKDGQAHSIRVRVSPSGSDLSGSPKSLSCPKPGGNLDGVTCNLISGWAWDPTLPNSAINIDILDGSTVVATILANQYRGDLYGAGLGNGYHAFYYVPGSNLLNGVTHSIRARISATLIDLYPTPVPLTCSVSP